MDWHGRESNLRTGLVALIHQVRPYLLVVGFIQDLVGINERFGIGNVVPGVLLGRGLAPGIAVIGLKVEIIADRLRICGPAHEAAAALVGSDALVHVLKSPTGVIGAVEGIQVIVAERIPSHDGHRTSGNSETLAKEHEPAGAHVPVVTSLVVLGIGKQVGGRFRKRVGIAPGLIALTITAVSELNAGFEEY